MVSVEVQWLPYPQEFLQPAVIAFKDAVAKCHAPRDQFQACVVTFSITLNDERHSELTTGVVEDNDHHECERIASNNSIEKAKHGLQNWSKSNSFLRRQQLQSGHRKLVACRPLCIISERPVLKTKVGGFLEKNRLLKPIALATLMIGILIQIFQPGTKSVRLAHSFHGPADEFRVSSASNSSIEALLYSMFFVIALHFLSSGLLRLSVKSFEGWWLVINQAIMTSAHFYNSFCLSHVAGERDSFWISVEVLKKVIILLCVFVLCNIDAVVISRCWKMLGMSVYALNTLEAYASVRVFDSSAWTSNEICFYNGCSSPKYIYQLSLANMFVFIVKAVLSYSKGCEFAFLKISFQECGTREEAYQLMQHLILKEDAVAAPVDISTASMSYPDFLSRYQGDEALNIDSSPASCAEATLGVPPDDWQTTPEEDSLESMVLPVPPVGDRDITLTSCSLGTRFNL